MVGCRHHHTALLRGLHAGIVRLNPMKRCCIRSVVVAEAFAALKICMPAFVRTRMLVVLLFVVHMRVILVLLLSLLQQRRVIALNLSSCRE